MKIFGWEVTSTNVVIVGVVVVGGGACYALLRFLISPGNRKRSFSRKSGRRRDGDVDLELPLVLEHEYGSFRRVCLDADPVAARYLQEIPDHFFAFQENFLRFITDFVTKNAKRYRHVLVIGSGTGGLSFRLSTIFDEVKGLEKSFSQVVTCYQFQNLNSVSYFFPAEGGLKSIPRSVKSPLATSSGQPKRSSDGRNKAAKENIEFIHHDPDRHLPSYYGEFQAVIIQNCQEELENPLEFLSSLKNCVEAGGVLIICSDYNWKRKLNKPAGFLTSEVNNSLEFLKHVLSDSFKLKDEKNMPEVISDSARSCKIRFNNVTAWVRTKDVNQSSPISV